MWQQSDVTLPHCRLDPFLSKPLQHNHLECVHNTHDAHNDLQVSNFYSSAHFCQLISWSVIGIICAPAAGASFAFQKETGSVRQVQDHQRNTCTWKQNSNPASVKHKRLAWGFLSFCSVCLFVCFWGNVLTIMILFLFQILVVWTNQSSTSKAKQFLRNLWCMLSFVAGLEMKVNTAETIWKRPLSSASKHLKTLTLDKQHSNWNT